jgi:hypothetical protein
MEKYVELIVLFGFLAATIWGMLKFMLKDITRDLQDIRGEIHGVKGDISELKNNQLRLELKIDKTDARIDHLYEENNRLYKILVDFLHKK